MWPAGPSPRRSAATRDAIGAQNAAARLSAHIRGSLDMILAAPASGALVGFSLGLVGGGGSILATPLLVYVVGVAQPHIAIGTGALAVSVNAFVNFIGHARSGNVR